MSFEGNSVHKEDPRAEGRHRIQSEFEGRELEEVGISNGLIRTQSVSDSVNVSKALSFDSSCLHYEVRSFAEAASRRQVFQHTGVSGLRARGTS